MIDYSSLTVIVLLSILQFAMQFACDAKDIKLEYVPVVKEEPKPRAPRKSMTMVRVLWQHSVIVAHSVTCFVSYSQTPNRIKSRASMGTPTGWRGVRSPPVLPRLPVALESLEGVAQSPVRPVAEAVVMAALSEVVLVRFVCYVREHPPTNCMCLQKFECYQRDTIIKQLQVSATWHAMFYIVF